MKRMLFGILLLGLSLTANAQRDYSGTWEWSISALYQDSKSMGSENGSSLKADSAIGLGFNVGYYLTDHFSLGADFDFLRPDYNAILDASRLISISWTVRSGRLSKLAWDGPISTPMWPMARRSSVAGGTRTGVTSAMAITVQSVKRYSVTGWVQASSTGLSAIHSLS